MHQYKKQKKAFWIKLAEPLIKESLEKYIVTLIRNGIITPEKGAEFRIKISEILSPTERKKPNQKN